MSAGDWVTSRPLLPRLVPPRIPRLVITQTSIQSPQTHIPPPRPHPGPAPTTPATLPRAWLAGPRVPVLCAGHWLCSLVSTVTLVCTVTTVRQCTCSPRTAWVTTERGLGRRQVAPCPHQQPPPTPPSPRLEVRGCFLCFTSSAVND